MVEAVLVVSAVLLVVLLIVALLTLRNSRRPADLSRIEQSLRVEGSTTRDEVARELSRSRDETSAGAVRLLQSVSERVAQLVACNG